jgi:hypothetical protein
MILLCGIPSEPPLAMVRARLLHAGIPFVEFNQRRFEEVGLEVSIVSGEVTGELALSGRRYRLEDFGGVYTRLMNDSFLPELRREPPDSPARRRSAVLHDAFVRWCEIAPARVVNRIGPSGSNASKVYQSQLIRRFGFEVPDTLVTNDPERARAFIAEKGRAIFKSISGARSIVTMLNAHAVPSLDRVANCPTMFQEFIEGSNVRVHVVDQVVFATAVETTAVDYRYASEQVGVPARLTATTLDDEVAQRCVALTRHLGLAFSGIDLLVGRDGTVYCLEVNPCPGFSYYEANTSQPISQALARYLAAPPPSRVPSFERRPLPDSLVLDPRS